MVRVQPSLAAALLASLAIAQTPVDWSRARVLETRSGHAMAYDAARQRVVLFGGYDKVGYPHFQEVLMPGTWEWDGASWTQRQSAGGPAPRYFHAMAYDVARRRVVLFGGASYSSRWESDTWEWDGASWLKRQPASSPPGRARHAMAYDVARQRVVLFGGFTGTHPADTWEWDGSNWTQRPSATAPCGREHHTMAYDVARQRVVLFGGLTLAGGCPVSLLADTWEWDGSNWTQRRPPSSPPAFPRPAMAYDVARQRVVLVGIDRLSSIAETWEWDGSSWTRRQPATSPTPREEEAVAYDAARQRVVLFGGRSGCTLADTWEWDGSDWALRRPAASPCPRGGHTMTYDLARQRVVLFGGGVPFGAGTLTDTWEWDGSSWTLLQPATGPTRGAITYDPVRQRVVLFGGAETWEWDGASWTRRQPAAASTSQFGHALVWDLARQRAVLFGGSDGLNLLADTWEWDGASWTQRTPAASPGARYHHAMAYDFARQRVVLFGGSVGSTVGTTVPVAETWEWDGASWILHQPAISPSARDRHAMTYDFARQRVVLFGGLGQVIGADMWEWDGSSWTQRQLPTSPNSRYEHAMTYDVARQGIVLAGGAGALWYYGDTWILGAQSPAMAASFGSGCGGARGVPTLSAGTPYLGNRGFALELLDASPAQPCVFGLSAGTQSLPLGGGCTLHLGAPLWTGFALTNAFGVANVGMPVPRDRVLLGATLYAQAAVADPTGPAGGVSITAGMRLVLGD